jgi:hypothetical protein
MLSRRRLLSTSATGLLMAAVRRIPPAFAQSFDKRLRSSVGFRPNDSARHLRPRGCRTDDGLRFGRGAGLIPRRAAPFQFAASVPDKRNGRDMPGHEKIGSRRRLSVADANALIGPVVAGPNALGLPVTRRRCRRRVDHGRSRGHNDRRRSRIDRWRRGNCRAEQQAADDTCPHIAPETSCIRVLGKRHRASRQGRRNRERSQGPGHIALHLDLAVHCQHRQAPARAPNCSCDRLMSHPKRGHFPRQ